MRFYLGTLLGAGTEANPFTVAAGEYAIIDLRPDSTQLAGRCLIATPAPLSPIPTGWRDLGDVLDGSLSAQIRNRLGNDLSVTLEATTPRGVIAELLILHGRTDGSRWKPLKATHAGRNRIVLFNEVIFDAPVIVGATITDNFDRANETPLAAPWTMQAGTGTVNLASNVLTSTNTGETYYRYDGGDLDTDDHYAEIVNVAISNNSDYYGPLVRYSSSANTCYVGSIREHATADSRIIKVVAAAVTVLSTGNNSTPAAPYTTRLTVDGSTLTLTGHVTLSTTDTDITGNVRVGFFARNFATGQTGNNFAASDLHQTVTGTLFTKAPTFFTGTVTASYPLTGTLFTKAPTFFTGAVSLAAGPQTVSGVLYQNVPTFFTGTLASTYALTGTLYQNAPFFFTGAVTTTYTLTGTLYQNAPTFPQGSVTTVAGPQTVSGVLFTKAPTFFTGAMLVDQTITGTLYQNTPTFFTGTLTSVYPLTGALYQNTPVFFTGNIVADQALTGVLYQNTPVFFQGVFAPAGSLFGNLYQNTPVFFVGTMGYVGGSFWQVNPAGYTLNPVAYTVNGAAYDPILGGELPPWAIEVDGEIFELAPLFFAGSVS